MSTPAQPEKTLSPLMRLANEESTTLRGIFSADHPSVDHVLLDRLIVANREALNRQMGLLQQALVEHQSHQQPPIVSSTLQRLETMLEHTARLVHESQVLQKLRSLLYNA